jgi:hypothetical protein
MTIGAPNTSAMWRVTRERVVILGWDHRGVRECNLGDRLRDGFPSGFSGG